MPSHWSGLIWPFHNPSSCVQSDISAKTNCSNGINLWWLFVTHFYEPLTFITCSIFYLWVCFAQAAKNDKSELPTIMGFVLTKICTSVKLYYNWITWYQYRGIKRDTCPFLIFLYNTHRFPDSSTNVVGSYGTSGYNKITAGNFTLELILFN